jgi:hypothetical protein
MKDIMEFGPCWQLQLVWHFPHTIDDLERTVEFRSQFSFAFGVKRSNRAVQESQPYPLPNLEAHVPVRAIIKQLVVFAKKKQLVVLLCLFQTFLDLHEKSVPVQHLMVN